MGKMKQLVMGQSRITMYINLYTTTPNECGIKTLQFPLARYQPILNACNLEDTLSASKPRTRRIRKYKVEWLSTTCTPDGDFEKITVSFRPADPGVSLPYCYLDLYC